MSPTLESRPALAHLHSGDISANLEFPEICLNSRLGFDLVMIFGYCLSSAMVDGRAVLARTYWLSSNSRRMISLPDNQLTALPSPYTQKKANTALATRDLADNGRWVFLSEDQCEANLGLEHLGK
ncbi:hypothetical protein FQN52_007502 [Onygenales sp. PD_12]|nr:hypothetical protein FQN52_007502 [Onygenales sp. PD_12]